MSILPILALPPTISDSTNFATNFTRLLKIDDEITSNSITDGFATLSGGHLVGLNNPVMPQDGATKDYVDNDTSFGTAAPPPDAVQFNNNGLFGGSSNMLFNKITNTLTINALSDSVATIGSGTINNMVNPTMPQDATTKNYSDQVFSLTLNTYNSASGLIYNGSDMINTVISRNLPSGTGFIVDKTAQAADIVAAATIAGYYPVVGMTFIFCIKNISTDYSNIIQLEQDNLATVSFGGDSPQNIYAGYQLTTTVILNNVTLGSEAATMYFSACTYSNPTPNYLSELYVNALSIKTINVTDYALTYIKPSAGTSEITFQDIQNKIVLKNPTAPTTYGFGALSDFMGGVIQGQFINLWTTGGVDFYILNQSTSVGANITIVGGNGWIMDVHSNMLIPPGYTGWFYMYLVVDFPYIAISGSIYTLGIYPSG